MIHFRLEEVKKWKADLMVIIWRKKRAAMKQMHAHCLWVDKIELLKASIFFHCKHCIKLCKCSNWEMKSNITLERLQMGFYITHTLFSPTHKNKCGMKYGASAYANLGNCSKAQSHHKNPYSDPNSLLIIIISSPVSHHTPGMAILLVEVRGKSLQS